MHIRLVPAYRTAFALCILFLSCALQGCLGAGGAGTAIDETHRPTAEDRQEILRHMLTRGMAAAPASLPALSFRERETLGPYTAQYDFLRKDVWGRDLPERLAGLDRNAASLAALIRGDRRGFQSTAELRSRLNENRRSFSRVQESMQSLLGRLEERKQALPSLDAKTAPVFEAAYTRLAASPVQKAIDAARACRDLAAETDAVIQAFGPAIKDGRVDEKFTILEARKSPEGDYRVRYTIHSPAVSNAEAKAETLLREARAALGE